MAVIWEGFANDLFIAYLNRRPSRFTKHLKRSFCEHIHTRKKIERVFKSFGSLKIPDHLTKSSVIMLADQDRYNITFSQYKEIEAKARRWLVPADAAKFVTLSAPNKATIDALITLRN